MRVLITGITGFVGSHLVDYLLAKHESIEIYGIHRWRSRTENIDNVVDKLHLVECDIRDSSSVRNVVDIIKPDRIFHLAAQSFVPTSWHAPAETISTNIIGNLNIFEAVRQSGFNPRILVAGSSEEYGLVYENELPIKEENPLRPLSPYAVSKVGQDLLAYQYFMSYQVDVVRSRAFNHTGPRRGYVFVSSNFAKQFADIEKGKNEPVIYTGNLAARRDFTDVRDMVRAYWLALEKCEAGEVYNICSGKDYSIKQILDILMSFTNVKIEIKQDPKRMRPSDVPVLRGDNSKFCKKTGWKPEIPFEQTLLDILNYWRSRA
ncbi:MAG: GDP-mannose 4,6-dehydratase [Candidatus Schekmanbacteria bacterium RBG_16_38_11]|uniref:GDP-mannose 4,6-dehydratase n=1 Tax=Candidatus Schekmanbacteria bacterium RBG_16_38_11 TaxID=1817880 RepID=A0A1F7RX91_9BACT|nr:MAG: GDP-mannose 4,6-dehydratase [Candidatus Schekmanbacteria bacterium RBG_16_38_11]